MIVTKKEISEFESLLDSCTGNKLRRNVFATEYLFKHAHLLLTCGFDEIRYLPGNYYPDGIGDFILTISAEKEEVEKCLEQILAYYTLNCRQAKTGAWYQPFPSFLPIEDRKYPTPVIDLESQAVVFTPLISNRDEFKKYADQMNHDNKLVFSFDEILNRCHQSHSSTSHFGAIILPNLWFPPEKYSRIELADVSIDILKTFQNEPLSFDKLSPRQFEELVADILKSRGMDVSITNKGPDGGRDIIARGELASGDPMVMAVEVKHKNKVGIDEVRSRLYANEEFPLIMFATSGSFTAGVVREKEKPKNFLRMLLKDGVALQQWIDAYKPDQK